MNKHIVKLARLLNQKRDTPKVVTNPINPRTLGHLDKLVKLGVIASARRKKASLDNNWIAQDPKTKTWDYTSLADEKEMPQYGIYPSWFRTRVFDDFVFDALDQGLYGTERFKGKWADQDKNLIEKDFSDYGPNFTPNKACKQIYKQLKALTPEKIKQLRDENAKYYSYYPSEDEIKHFIDYFGRHAAAGHSMISE